MTKTPPDQKDKDSIHQLARLMDSAIKIPGTKISFGLDPLIGLVPGLGDTVSTLVSFYIIIRAESLGVPKVVLARMITNVFIDSALGAIPLIGDIFDFAWKANLKNVELINRYSVKPSEVKKKSAGFLIVILIAVFLLLTLIVTTVIFLVKRVIELLFI